MQKNHFIQETGTPGNFFSVVVGSQEKRSRGVFLYVKGNHLGNVLVVVSDARTVATNSGGNITSFAAVVNSAQDLYVFGSEMANRSFQSANYKYGFDYQEKDDEITGNSGSVYSAKYWEYDAHLGRRWNCDPISKPALSQYSVLGDNPIRMIDPIGNDWFYMPDGTYEFSPDIHSQEDIDKMFPGKGYEYSGATMEELYTDGSKAEFRSDGSIWFSDEQHAYRYMWINSTAHGQYKEYSGIITPNGVLVYPSYNNKPNESGAANSYGYTVTGTGPSDTYVKKGDEEWKMIGFIHTHSMPYDVRGDGPGLSSYDLWATERLNGVPMIAMEANDKLISAKWMPGDNGWTSVKLNQTVSGLLTGKQKLIPDLKNMAKPKTITIKTTK